MLHNKKIFPTCSRKTIDCMTTTPKIHLLEQRESVQPLEYQRITPPSANFQGSGKPPACSPFHPAFLRLRKDDLPILQSESPTAEVELRRLLPGSSWHIEQLGYTEGDVEINAAWQGMTVDFTSDTAFFYCQDLVLDLILQTSTTKNTLTKRCIYGQMTAKSRSKRQNIV